ncbi:MAG: HAD family phosphatase [SAR202 cluster bacterium]|nr:HAD family phosphatase [SAR202 cluster bacterium]
MANYLRAACFDFDGLTVDSEPLHFESTRLAMAGHGIAYTQADGERYIGGTVEATMLAIARDYGIPDGRALLSARDRYFDELVRTQLQPRPGVRRLLDRLAERRVPCALVTSGTRSYVETASAQLGLRGYFAAVVAAEDVARHKPDPEPYLKAAAALGVAPSLCLALEDSPTGARSAKRAGMYCIAVPSQSTAYMDLSRADLRIESMEIVDSSLLNTLFGPL